MDDVTAPALAARDGDRVALSTFVRTTWIDVLWMPVLPTDLPAGLDRALTAAALGLAVAGAGVVVWSGALAVVAPTGDELAGASRPDPTS